MSRRSIFRDRGAVLPRPPVRLHRVRRSIAALGLAVTALACEAATDDPDGARVVAGLEHQIRAIFEKCQPA